MKRTLYRTIMTFFALLLPVLWMAGSAGAQTAPSSRDSLVKWFDADAITDGVDGAAYTGSANGFTQTIVANQPTYLAHGFLNGHACLRFAGTQYLSKATDTGLDSLSASDCTFTFVFRQSNASSGGGYGGVFAKNPAAGRLFFILQNGVFERYSDLVTPAAVVLNRAYVIEYSLHITGANTGIETLYYNGLQVAQVTGTLAAWNASAAYIIGGYGTVAGFTGDIVSITADNVVLTQPQMTSDVAYYRSRYYDPSQVEVSFIGDSRTYGTDMTQAGNLSPYPYPLQTKGLNNPYNINYNNLGHGGWGTAPMLADAPLRINPFNRQIAVLWGGINDLLVNGLSSEPAAFTTFQKLVNLYEANWCQTVVLTEIDAAFQFETWRVPYNASIRTAFPTLAGKRVLVDAATNPLVGVDGASNNATYFSSDHIHPIGQAGGGGAGGGYGVIASLVGPPIISLLQSPPATGSGAGPKRRLQ